MARRRTAPIELSSLAEAPKRLASRLRKDAFPLLLVIAFGLGALLAAAVPRPIVGLITLNDAIYWYTAQDMIEQIRYARDDSRVRAVVLVLDSPGGTVTDTEAVYLELARLREVKPVVAMIQGLGASGAYYLSVGTDHIVAGPNANVGNVGVISQLPPEPAIYEDIVSTGPYKLWGSPRDTVLREMEAIKQGFYEAVQLGRGGALRLDREYLLRGQIWQGNEALRLGLVDELGSQSTAIERAAALARISNYEVRNLRTLAGLPDQVPYPFFMLTEDGRSTALPRDPGIYLLFIPPAAGAFR
ncbi:MAG: S49 family peptidase [Anaerolineales bacterium]